MERFFTPSTVTTFTVSPVINVTLAAFSGGDMASGTAIPAGWLAAASGRVLAVTGSADDTSNRVSNIAQTRPNTFKNLLLSIIQTTSPASTVHVKKTEARGARLDSASASQIILMIAKHDTRKACFYAPIQCVIVSILTGGG
jgi:hypothetical protein